jgi:hypothetical protein
MPVDDDRKYIESALKKRKSLRTARKDPTNISA